MTDNLLQDLISRITFQESEGQIWLDEHRMLLMHASSFGALRHELIESLGYERAQGLLFRMGSSSGQQDALLVRRVRPDACVEEAFMVGPQLHRLEGVVHTEPVKLEVDIEKKTFEGEFIWRNSFEAGEHLRCFGVSDIPVCWNQTGYASGYTSDFMGTPVIFKEVECIAKGDPNCRIVGKPLNDWPDSRDLEQLQESGSIAETLYKLQDNISILRESSPSVPELVNVIAESPNVRGTLDLVRKAAAVDVTVLFLGPTGSGKEVFSAALHNLSSRASQPLVSVNCAAIPNDLIESELFGVEKGAYTGAVKSRPGRFERAHQGTLFLDEIAELPLRAQAKLLRVLQTGELDRLGGKESMKVDVRLITATNRDLEDMVSKGEFRADLYYRINVFPILIAGLSDRPEDIIPMAEQFIKQFNARYDKCVAGLSYRAIEVLQKYDWPGNVRELENILERAVILTDNGEMISSENISLKSTHGTEDDYRLVDGQFTLPESVPGLVSGIINSGTSFQVLEKEVLRQCLVQNDGNVAEAARMLSMGDAQFRYRIKKYKLNSGR